MKWFSCVVFCLLLSGCGFFDWRSAKPDEAGNRPDEAAGLQPETRPLATTLVYDCAGYEAIARLAPGSMALWLPDKYVVLSQARSASGTLYEEGDISFWSKGDDAMLTVGEHQYLNCQLQPKRAPWEDARRRGVNFRAVGNAPGWQLEINRQQQMLFTRDRGIQRVVVHDEGEKTVGKTHIHRGRSGAHTLKVEIRNQDCDDSLTSEVLSAEVTVTFDDTTYRGCGEYLAYPWKDSE